MDPKRNKSLRCVVLGLFGIAGSAMADSPTRPPYDHSICSSLARHCAFISATDGAKVFGVKAGNENIPILYSIAGWYSQAYLSDDGQKFIAVESIIVPGHIQDQPVLRLWVGGALKRSVYLNELLGGRKPTKSTSGYVWGKVVGFQGDDHFILQLDDGSKYDIKL
jgi:hypothetical protein